MQGSTKSVQPKSSSRHFDSKIIAQYTAVPPNFEPGLYYEWRQSVTVSKG